MKVYIAGSITKDKNYINRFNTAEAILKKQGHAVINPVKNIGFSYKDYIDMGLCELMKCDAIFMLKGYKESKGALLELHYAKITRMKIIYEH